MEKVRLTGFSILIVEDERLIALDIIDRLRKAGESLLTTQKLGDGLREIPLKRLRSTHPPKG